jgi:hypothetical protein
MIARNVQQLQKAALIALVVVGTLLAVLWAAGNVGASSSRPLFGDEPQSPKSTQDVTTTATELEYEADIRPATMINYQGVINVDGSPYNGLGYFKFQFVDSASGDGSVNYWANDGTASGEPAKAVTLPVSNGLFNVMLGDTGLEGLDQPLEAGSFTGGDTYLRVRFSATGEPGTFQDLNPNQRIAPGVLPAADVGAQALGSVYFWRQGLLLEGTPPTYAPLAGRVTTDSAYFKTAKNADVYFIFPAPGTQRVVDVVRYYILSRTGSYGGNANVRIKIYDFAGNQQHVTSSAATDFQLAATGAWTSIPLDGVNKRTIEPGEFLAIEFRTSGAAGGDLEVPTLFEVQLAP